MKGVLSFGQLFRLSLMGVVLVTLLGGCERQGDEVKQAGDAIKQFAAKQNLRAGRNRFSGIIDGAAGEVCACLKVCDANGQNCTACSCSPANCGSCD
jgi:hypothetical protein